MLQLLGILCVLSAFIVGIWLGIFVMLIGGIIQFVQAFQVNPISAYEIACGLVRVFCSGIVGWLSFGVLLAFGVALLQD